MSARAGVEKACDGVSRIARVLPLLLALAGCVPAGLPEPEARAPFPVPATFGGVLPCSDCAGVRTAVLLREDGVFLLRQTFPGRAGGDDELVEAGRWRLRDDGRVLSLAGANTSHEFGVLDDDRLAPLDRLGQPLAGGVLHELVRGDGIDAFQQPYRWRGTLAYVEEVAMFRECRSGLILPVAEDGAAAQLRRAWLATRAGEGAELMFTLRGRLVQGPAVEGEGPQDMLLVDEVDRAWPSEHCGVAPLLAAPSAGLEDTVWWVRAVDGAALPADAADRPRMRLLPSNARLEAFGGCNAVFGSYQADGNRLSFDGVAASRKTCASLQELEDRVLEVLRSTDGYVIDNGVLVLYTDGVALAEWVATPP